MMVFVLDKHKKPLMPCTEKRARLLLRRGRAVVHRIAPFTIRLKDRVAEESALQPLRLKVKPGAKETGMAVLREETTGESEAVMLLELRHKPGIKQSLDSRRAMRRSRRNRKTRYRRPRFDNRNPAKCAACGRNARHGSRYCRPCERARNFVDNGYREKRLPASLEARANQIMNTVKRLTRLLPIASISYENAKFDTQLLQNPEIAGVEYQQGELFGYEVREYLLEKWGRQCAYCGKNGVPLEIEHIVPKSRDGTDRVSNLTLACKDCNQGEGDPDGRRIRPSRGAGRSQAANERGSDSQRNPLEAVQPVKEYRPSSGMRHGGPHEEAAHRAWFAEEQILRSLRSGEEYARQTGYQAEIRSGLDSSGPRQPEDVQHRQVRFSGQPPGQAEDALWFYDRGPGGGRDTQRKIRWSLGWQGGRKVERLLRRKGRRWQAGVPGSVPQAFPPVAAGQRLAVREGEGVAG